MIFREDDSLEEFLDRIVLALYIHFRALTGSHMQVARVLRISREYAVSTSRPCQGTN